MQHFFPNSYHRCGHDWFIVRNLNYNILILNVKRNTVSLINIWMFFMSFKWRYNSEYFFFICLLVTCGPDEFFSCTSWTGANDLIVEGSYVWDHSNTSLSFTKWHPQEPSLLKPSEASTRDCIDLLRSGRWNDRPCLYSNTFICEKNFRD